MNLHFKKWKQFISYLLISLVQSEYRISIIILYNCTELSGQSTAKNNQTNNWLFS